MEQGWYWIETPSGGFYTDSVPTKKQWFYAGDGERQPTPKEMKDLLTSGSNENYIDDYSGLVYNYEGKESTKDPVELPAGCYNHMPASPSGSVPERLMPVNLRDDSYIKMESIYNPLVDDMKAFIRSEHVYRAIGTIYKRGLLLYGPPGEGKTSMIRCVIKNELPKDAIVVFFEMMPSNEFITKMKETLGTRLKVFIFEELANLLENARIERVLDFLDGEKSIDKTLIVATTNYPERLPGNIVERPSRFDKLYKMGHPKKDERRLLLNHYLIREATADEITVTEGLSTAALKECAFLVHMKGIPLSEAAKLLKAHSELVKKEFSESKPIGFTNRWSHDD